MDIGLTVTIAAYLTPLALGALGGVFKLWHSRTEKAIHDLEGDLDHLRRNVKTNHLAIEGTLLDHTTKLTRLDSDYEATNKLIEQLRSHLDHRLDALALDLRELRNVSRQP